MTTSDELQTAGVGEVAEVDSEVLLAQGDALLRSSRDLLQRLDDAIPSARAGDADDA